METEKILLRPWHESDAETLYKYASDPDVGPRAGWPPHKSINESREVIRTVFNDVTNTWAIELKETKEAIVKAHYPYAKEDANLSLDEAWSLYDYLDDNNNTWNNIGFMAWIVAIITLIITLLGVYSAISIDTTRRRKEMALRKINGAVTAQIALLFARLYMKLFAISSVVSIPLSAFIIKGMILNGRYDKGAVYAIIFYLFVLAIMVAFVALTIGFKIRRIARENPADVIKSE